jgi:hypothetical protein
MAVFDYDLYGSVPIVKKFQYGVTLTQAGIPFTVPAADTAGVVIGTTTGATDLVGMSLDKGNVTNLVTGIAQAGTGGAAYTTTQGSGTSSAERAVSLIINPFAVWAWKMSGGATEDTVLALQTVTSANAGGTAVTTGATWSGTTLDEGVTWGYSGANAGRFRKVTSVSATAGTVTIPFDYAIAVGDVFLRAPYWPMQTVTVQFTTNLYQADASIAVGTGAPFRVVELRLRDTTDAGQTNSFVLAVSNSHALNLA